MPTIKSFENLGLTQNLLLALADLGYEATTPIQAASIPVLLVGEDLLAQAQTGTGKTAAFALPILTKLDIKIKKPQALIVAPTRELAIQVAEAFQSYAKHLTDFHVTPIYGGQEYSTQLRALKRGSHVIVGTPGRLMDHMRKGTLKLDALKTVILDEADEMLKMGFIDDIEWILEQIAHSHQIGLFSATMPETIQKIAKRYLKDAKKIIIKSKTSTVDTIEQSYMMVSKNQKLDALTRYLEVEDIEASIIFARTKNASAELAEKLQARGYAAAALNGDMNQSLRKAVIERIKKGSLDIIVATDVAARGIDVDRVSHVINYDIPYDTDSYIHRVGRTGRAGRTGKALLFITPRENRLLKDIERAIRSPIERTNPPSVKEMSEKRGKQLAEKIVKTIRYENKKMQPYHELIKSIIETIDCAIEDVAAALAILAQQGNPLPSHDIEAAKPEKNATRHQQRRRPNRAKKKNAEQSYERRKKRFSKDSKPAKGKRKPSRGKVHLRGKNGPSKSKGAKGRGKPRSRK